eukprot:SAG31_NODE_6780_length_1891_cov_1.550223_1_plen_387_part_00
MACWLELPAAKADALLANAAAPPWQDGDRLLTGGQHGRRLRPAAWERCSRGGDCGHWVHDVLWCARPADQGDVAIHRFSPLSRAGAETAAVCSALLDIAQAEHARAARSADDAESASNIGGFHSERDLCERGSFHRTGLPALLATPLRLAAEVEAAGAKRGRITTTMDEAWFNAATEAGNWNCLHTHFGSTYSATFFVADGGCCGKACTNQLAGRLVFVPNAPSGLPAHTVPYGDYHLHHIRRLNTGQQPSVKCDVNTLVPGASEDENNAGEVGNNRQKRQRTDQGTSSSRSSRQADAPEFLLIDPVPGTFVVFPSFLPHFVMPTAPKVASPQTHDANHEAACSQCSDTLLRLSVAFNFGACEPVDLTMYEQDGKVKIFFEIHSVY